MLKGSCHCGKVEFTFQEKPSSYTYCHCSICEKKSATYHLLKEGDFQLLSSKDNLSEYQFGTKTAKHFFCSKCGIHTHCNPRLFPERVAVNLNCVDAIDISTLKRFDFEGPQD